MAAFILTELSDWNENYRWRTVIFMVGVVTLTGMITKLRPEYCFIVTAIMFCWIGFLTGKYIGSSDVMLTWVREAGLTLWKVILGKLALTILITLTHLFLLMPIMILVNSIWGVTWIALIKIGFVLVNAALISSSFGMLSEYMIWPEESFPGVLLVLGWLLVTLIFPFFSIINPFAAVLQILIKESGRYIIGYMIANIVLIFILIIILRYILRGEVQGHHED